MFIVNIEYMVDKIGTQIDIINFLSLKNDKYWLVVQVTHNLMSIHLLLANS